MKTAQNYQGKRGVPADDLWQQQQESSVLDYDKANQQLQDESLGQLYLDDVQNYPRAQEQAPSKAAE